ncbi:MAG: tetratricopeptide (TPR) repeat protein [Planctomycetota bacterium]|jgi:tetratricopeptide (TPR) repeat protein
MNTLPKALLFSSLLGAATGALTATLISRPVQAGAGEGNQEQALTPDALSSLRADYEALVQRLNDTESALQQANSMAQVPIRQNANQAGIEDLVRRLIAENAEAGGAATQAAKDDDRSTAGASDLYARLNDPELSPMEKQELWQEIRESGRLEEVVEFLEARAQANPNDPELEVELGAAILQRIQEVGNGPLAGVLATQADDAFNRALKLDGSHWDARYNKAVALSFWPPVFGKQPAAIAEFETLVAQQSQSASQPSFAQTHLMLGNLYQQTGQYDKAVAAWQNGAQLFPNNSALAQQLALAQQSQH